MKTLASEKKELIIFALRSDWLAKVLLNLVPNEYVLLLFFYFELPG